MHGASLTSNWSGLGEAHGHGATHHRFNNSPGNREIRCANETYMYVAYLDLF